MERHDALAQRVPPPCDGHQSRGDWHQGPGDGQLFHTNAGTPISVSPHSAAHWTWPASPCHSVCMFCRTVAWWWFVGQADAGRGPSEIRPSRMDDHPSLCVSAKERAFQPVEPAPLLSSFGQFRQLSCSPATRVKEGHSVGPSLVQRHAFFCCAFQEMLG